MKCCGRIALGWVLVTPAWFFLCGGCAFVPSVNKKLAGNRAFIDYWPPDPNNKQLTLAVKDNIDMKGIQSTVGSQYFQLTRKPAKWDAACLENARERNVKIVGKTNMTEFAVSPSGINEYFGTARNPLRRTLVPGGSSSGSAVAVASGMADVAFGTDTAGSIRVPAACCGVVGLKTTFGLIPLNGVYPVEPKHLDTVGPMGKDIDHTVQGMDLLENGFAAKYAAAKSSNPDGRRIRIGRLRLKGTDRRVDQAIDEALNKTGFQVMTLDDDVRQAWDQAKADGNTMAAAGAWMSDQKFQIALGVTARTQNVIRLGQITYTTTYRSAVARRRQWQHTLANVFHRVDFIALPTLQTPPPELPLLNLRLGILEAQMLTVQNTVPVNVAGNPALAIPVPMRGAKTPVASLQLIGPQYSEADLLNAGRLVEEAVKR